MMYSYSERVLKERRARLNEDILEALICVKDWEDGRLRGQTFTDDVIEDFSNLDIFYGSTTYAST